MKKLIFILLFLNFLTSAFAQEKAKIIFIRSTGYIGSAGKFKCFIDKKIVCKLNNKRYSEHEVDAGKRQVDVQFGGTEYKANDEPIFLDVEPGKSYFVQLTLKTGILKNNILCQEITQNSAKVMMKDLKQDDCF